MAWPAIMYNAIMRLVTALAYVVSSMSLHLLATSCVEQLNFVDKPLILSTGIFLFILFAYTGTNKKMQRNDPSQHSPLWQFSITHYLHLWIF